MIDIGLERTLYTIMPQYPNDIDKLLTIIAGYSKLVMVYFVIKIMLFITDIFYGGMSKWK